MNKQLKFIFLLSLFAWLNIDFVKAQPDFSDEAEFKKHANKLFEEDEFEAAYPLFSQLLSVYPKDPDYNYRFGVCTLFASDDKEKAISFLEFAENKDVEKEVMYYLAKAYHLNYRFDDAIAEYTKYKKVASANKANKLQVDRQIEMCKNGKQLLHNLTDLVVIEKKEMSREEFFRAYDISQIGGKLLVKPDEKQFRTAVDKKKKEKSIIYLSGNNNQVFFSSYGEDATKGKDIYTTKRLENGEWSKPVSLGAPVNTEYDEDYPFLHPNGKDLYFCSKGHNSMGGYDVFKSTYNEETKKWSNPVNLDFPINTPDDDILFVTDSAEKQAYFSSSRASITGKTEVYHINTERKPIDAAVIAGNVIKNRDDEKLNVKITVKNLADNSIIGMYNSIPTDGSYGMNLPNGGKFLFTVESPDFPIQSEVVVIPVQNEFKPVKQEISYELKTDKLVVKNIFETGGGDANYLMALKFIKEKAKLNVNVNEVAVAVKPETTNVQPEAVVKSTKPKPGTPLTNDDIIKIAKDDAKSVETEAKEAKEQADIALTYANQKNDQAQNKTKEASNLFDEARASNDNVKKKELSEKANDAQSEAQQLNEETVNAFNLAKKLEMAAESKQKEADLSKEYAKDLEVAVKSKNSAQAMAKLDEQEKKLEELSKENEGIPAIANSLKLDVDNKKKELDKAIQSRNDIKQEIADNETIIASTKADAENTKSVDLKKGLLVQIDELTNENKTKQKELEDKDAKVTQLQKEYNGIKNQNELINSVVEQAKTSTSEVAATTAAAVDKAKLEEKVNEIKKTIAANNTAVAANSNPDNKSATSSDEVKTSNNKEVKDNNKQAAANNNKGAASTDKQPGTNNKSTTNDNKTVADNKGATSAEKQPDTNNKVITDENKTVADNNKGAISTDKQPDTNNKVTTDGNKENVADNKGEAKGNEHPENNNKTASTNETLQDLNKKYSDEIAATDKITNEIEREQAKTVALQNYNKAIDEHIQKGKSNLKTATKPEDKRQLIKDIGDAEKLSKDLKTQTKTSLAKVEDLKKQPVAVADNTNKTDSTKSSSPDVKELVNEDYTTINKKYSDEITSTNKIENEVDREKAKSEILKKWNTTIDAKIEKQKEDLKAITNESDKKAAEKNIAEAETLSNDVKTQTQESVARVETLKQKENAVAITENKQPNANSNKETNNKTNDTLKKNNEPIATNTKPETNNKPASTKINIASDDTFETINKKYDEGITNTDNITGELEKEKAKSEMLKDWKTAVDNKIKTQKEELKKVKDTEQKKEITKNIKDAEQKSKEIKKQSDESLAKVTDLKKKQNAVAVNADNKTSNNPTDASSAKVNKDTVKSTDEIKQPVVANKQPESVGNNNGTIKTDSAGGAIPVTKAATAEKQSFYTSPKAIEEIAKVDLISKQADEIKTQARELKTKAAEEKNEETKTSMIEQADALVKQADSKKAEANIAAATANKSEYNYNQNQIEQLANLSKNNKSDEIAMADMLNDESKIYYNKAEKSRKAADTTKAGYEKETALAEANSNEILALQKQKKAVDIYKKYNPDFVASATDKSSETNKNTTSNPKTNKTTAVANKTNKNGVAVSNNVKSGNVNKANTDKNPVASNVQKDTSDTSNTENTVASAANSPDNKTADNVSNSTKNGNENKDENTRDNSTSGNVNPIDNSTSNNTENESKKNSKKDSLLNAVANNITKTNVTPPVNKETNTSATKPIVNNKTTAIKLAPNESFEKKTIAVYSAKKPIPVNEKLPEGLVFKVQIGAFKKPIPQDLFKGITPITGETTTQGFTRYTAGVFIKFATADFAKNQIRDFGYKDAFVVAFLNGKRISMSQALSMAGIEFAASSNTQTPTAATNTTTTTATQPAAANNNKETSNNQPAAIKEINEIAPATNISAIGGGLFYTVQVGVFSLPVSSAKLYNVTSLYTETAPNGNLRYNVGVFSNTARAVEAKNILIETGIKDAFVTAYYNGKRISLADAKQLETQGNITFSSGPNVNTLPKFSISNNGETIVNETQPNKEKLETRIENKEPTEKAVNPETKKEEPKTEKKETRPKNEEPKAEKKEPKPENEEQPIAKKEESAVTSEQPAPVIDSTKKETADKVASNNPPSTEAGVVFKVQIGAFKDEVPLDIANKFLKVASKGIKNYKDENGLTIYTVGSYKTYEEAAKMKSELADAELNDAFIVAYKDGKKISVEEAKEK